MNIYCFFQEMFPKIDWVAVSALVVAIVSLFLSVRFNRKTLTLTKEHNRKTVEPFLTDYYLDMSEAPKSGLKYQEYSIKNCGPGPAIIKSLTYLYDNKDFERLEVIYGDYWSRIEPNGKSSFTNVGVNFILSPNEKIELFQMSSNNGNLLKDIIAFNKEIGLRIVYASVYGVEKTFKRAKIYSLETIEKQSQI